MLLRAVALAGCGSCLAACGGSASPAATDSGTTDLGASDAACIATSAPSEAGVSVTVDGGVLFGTAMNVDPCANRAEALIVAGSGPTDRNGNDPPSLDTNTYLELASHFGEKDVSSIRYDKRGIGQSAAAGPNEVDLTFDEYVDDARAWVRSMRQAHPNVPVIMVGHSEGSLIGILASESEAVDALLSLEGAVRPAGEVLEASSRRSSRAPISRRDGQAEDPGARRAGNSRPAGDRHGRQLARGRRNPRNAGHDREHDAPAEAGDAVGPEANGGLYGSFAAAGSRAAASAGFVRRVVVLSDQSRSDAT